jgi:TonB family protein
MANASSIDDATVAPDGFVEALNGLAVGIVSLDFVRRALVSLAEAGEQPVAELEALIAEAFDSGRISAEDFEILSRDLGRHVGEDEPTEWSAEVVAEAAPTSDTIRRDSSTTHADPTGAAPSQLYPGAVLRNRFVLQSRLDSSGMSEVFKALDRRRQEAGAESPWVAIKLVSPSHRHFPEALRLLQREAALAQRLDHPNIVRVFDFDRDGEHAFITMEWLEGESLADLLTRQRHRPLTPARARQILREIGAALQFAHGRGITHADVKPGNIFLTREGGAKLLDFGIARSTQAADDAPGADARTPAYASCEMLEGKEPTVQDDVYSLACVAYRMLTGRRALGAADALAAEAAGRRPTRAKNLADSQWHALEHALAFRRDARTADMASFLREFEPPTPAASAAVPGVPATAAAGPTARIAPSWFLTAAGLAAVALAAILWRGPDSGDAQPALASPQLDTAAPPQPTVATAVPAPARATDAQPGAADRATAPAIAKAPPQVQPTAGIARPAERAQRSQRKDEDRAPDEEPPSTGEPERTAVTAQNSALGGPLLASVVPTAIAPGASSQGAVASAAGQPPAPAPTGALATAPAGPPEVTLSSLKFKRYVKPATRLRARDDDTPGWVELRFTVAADGHTRAIEILASSPPGLYDRAARAAVNRWRFEPVLENGEPVERRSAVRLRFQPE